MKINMCLSLEEIKAIKLAVGYTMSQLNPTQPDNPALLVMKNMEDIDYHQFKVDLQNLHVLLHALIQVHEHERVVSVRI